VPCRLGISDQGSFSGPGGFNSNPLGIGGSGGVSGVAEIDGTGQFIILMLSVPV